MSPVDLLVPPDAEAVSKAVGSYAAALRERCGDRLRGVYLFGSRARGDFKPFSDIDLAVVLADPAGQASHTMALSEVAYDVFLETGAEVQPWVFREVDWDEPEHSASPPLVRSAKRDARAIPLS